MNIEKINLMVAEGEGLAVEFKEKYTSKIDRDIVALANSRGGVILLGIIDDGKVVGEKLTNRMKAEIADLARNCEPHVALAGISQIGGMVVIEVSEGREKPYSCSSGYFRRLDAITQKMTQREVRTIFRETTDVLFERLDCSGSKLEDISFKKIRSFLKEAKTSFKINKTNLGSFLASVGVYKNGRINNAGALMFAKDIHAFIPYSEMILAAFKGTDKTYIYDRKDVRDDLLIQLNESMAFLKRHLNIRSEIRELNRHDIYEIPLDALREALVNALVHRDYSMRGANASVNIFDDRVEIVNPGGLPAGISKDNFGKESIRRNLIIADLFHRMDKMERIGSGIGRMRSLMKESGLQEPTFESDTFFRAIFYRNPEHALKTARQTGREKTGEKTREKTREKILSLIRENPGMATEEMAAALGLSQKGIEWQIKKLKEDGLLRRVGPDKGGHWKVLK